MIIVTLISSFAILKVMKIKFLPVFLFLFLLPVFLAAEELYLKNLMQTAEPGGYVITEQNKTFTFLHIHDKTTDALVIEEVTIPATSFARHRIGWKEWFERGGPGHTSWTMSQINLQTGKLEETFSFTHQGWLDLSDSNPFLTTLFNLSFHRIPEDQRRRVGLAPGYGKPDHRPIWHPRLIVEGQLIPNIPFSVWKGRWPSDGSDLARKLIEIYLPYGEAHPNLPRFPIYFPYWLEVEGKIGSAKVRIVDSGTGASSPKGKLPLRPFSLIGEGQFLKEGLTFYLNAPSYYREFLILAEETTVFPSKTVSLPCEIFPYDKKTLTLQIPAEVLKAYLTPGETYRFLIMAKENPVLCLETKPVSFEHS